MILAPIPPAAPPRPPAAPFVVPPGGVPPLDVYDANEYRRKVSRYESEHLLELACMNVAWAFDGSFLHAAATAAELFAALGNAGIGRDCYVTGYVDPLPVVVVPASALRSRASCSSTSGLSRSAPRSLAPTV